MHFEVRRFVSRTRGRIFMGGQTVVATLTTSQAHSSAFPIGFCIPNRHIGLRNSVNAMVCRWMRPAAVVLGLSIWAFAKTLMPDQRVLMRWPLPLCSSLALARLQVPFKLQLTFSPN